MKEKKGVCEEYLRLNKTICESSKKQKSFFFLILLDSKNFQKHFLNFFVKNVQIFYFNCKVKLPDKGFCFTKPYFSRRKKKNWKKYFFLN